jgi:membrane-associated phospholipid phosphatase
MPFLPWTVWVYFTEYIIFLCAYFGLKDNENVMRYFYTYMIVFVISIFCFIVFPVTFPRQMFSDSGAEVSDHALYFLRIYMDNPKNCLPSLHVSTCFVSAFCFWRESKWKTAFFTLWALAVAISTMTTKQHYFVDVWTAFLLSLVVNIFCFTKLKLR